jgi:transcriptional regulator with XRE-family HTH domain
MKFLALGKRLKSFREKKKLALSALAKKSGVDESLLQSYEKDEQTPRIAELIKIAKALEINVADIFRERLHKKSFEILRREDQVRVSPLTEPSKAPVRDYLYSPLTLASPDKHLEAYLLEFPPFQAAKRTADLTHPGEEFIFILEGRLKIMVEGEEFEVGEGDSIFLRSSYPHALWNPFEITTKALNITYPF